jgi:signal transduction histidine kinase
MDREGFLFNDAFEQLIDIIRGGVEFLAREDRASQQRDAERKAKEKASKAKADFKAAIKFIERSPTLAKPDKVRIIREYTELTEKLEEVEDYNQAARQRLETMSALGVVSAFMTHEASRIVASLGDVLDELRRIARRHPAIKKDVERIEESYRALEGHLEYTKTFIDATQHGNAAVFKAAGQIKFVIDKFGDFAAARKIQVLQKVAREVDAPKMPVAVYSGILLNLYTNALKAILAVSSPKTEQKILFQAHNDRKMHIIEVMDTGIGIPPNMQKRVWDPLFTTTSSDDNPLGAGMGLGLSLVKSLVESRGGRVNIVEPAEGFTTCFRVQLPLR